jgi:hypothetical protein
LCQLHRNETKNPLSHPLLEPPMARLVWRVSCRKILPGCASS